MSARRLATHFSIKFSFQSYQSQAWGATLRRSPGRRNMVSGRLTR